MATIGIFSPREARLKETGDTDFGTPNPPVNLTVHPVSTSEIDLSWQPGPSGEFYNPTSFVIYRTIGDNLNFTGLTPYASVPASQLTYNNIELTPGTTYNYKVAAQNGGLESANSNLASATTLVSAPTAPENVIATAQNSSQIQISWSQVPGASDYKVYRKSNEPAFLLISTTQATGINDSNVTPNTHYSYYVVASNSGGDSPGSTIVEVTTPNVPSSSSSSGGGASDIVPPIISNVQVAPEINQATLQWMTDETVTSELDYGTSPTYGSTIVVGQGTQLQARLVNLTPSTTYFYKINARDNAGNTSVYTGLFSTRMPVKPLSPPREVTVTTTTSQIILTWVNPTDASFRGVRLVRKAGSLSQTSTDGVVLLSGVSQNFVDNGVVPGIIYYYTLYSFDAQNTISDGTFVLAQLSRPASNSGPSTTTPVAMCTMQPIDCAQPACFLQPSCINNSTSSSPVKPSVSNPQKLELSAIDFLAAHRTVRLTPQSATTITGLPGRELVIAIPKKNLTKTPRTITLTRSGTAMFLTLDSKSNAYEVSTLFPTSGSENALITVNYGNKTTAEARFILQTLALGQISTPSENSTSSPRLILFTEKGQQVIEDDPAQPNPLDTSDGKYGWIVPNGAYYLLIKYGQTVTTTPVFKVVNNVVNKNFNVTGRPLISSAPSTPISTLTNLFIRKVVTPLVAALALLGLFSQVSLFDILALLRLLFLQPFLLIRARKRDAWGEVYNSLNKLPVDLAIVRLVDTASNRIIQTRVTGRSGRYFFQSLPGKYRLEVLKNHMLFPSVLLAKTKNDGRKTDIYHGENIVITEQYPVITVNIPIDPQVDEKGMARLYWERFGRTVQLIISLSGMIATVYSLILTPHIIYLWILLLVHGIILFFFIRLAIPKRPEGWGVVTDAISQKALHNTVAKLYNTQYNRLVEYVLTDRKGRYYFLAGDSTYQVRYEKPEYKTNASETIDVRGKSEMNIALNIGLEREDQT